jgi:uncharacterized protein (TIGR00290 family)
LTTVTEDYDRVSMHGVRRILLEQQAQSIGLPLEIVTIPKTCGNGEWEAAIEKVLIRHRDQGVSAVAFGDIFLEDLKKYRESNLAKIGLKGIFPLWKQTSYILAKKFIDLKFKAIITCVDSEKLDAKFCGREYDAGFIAELPKDVDTCGENGEFHSFTYAGPIFKQELKFQKGPIVIRDDRFHFCDLIPNE